MIGKGKAADAPEMVSASDLGQFVFCPESARLKALGATPNSVARRRMTEGHRQHERWQGWEDAAPARAFSRAGRLLLIALLLAALAILFLTLAR
jgi:hypothetical protein